jgi:hypothetical protein
MIEPLETIARPELIAQEQRQQLAQLALERNWGLSLVLVGWLHLAIFLTCYYLTIVRDYHGSFGYLTLWLGELAAVGLIFRVCGGARRAEPPPLELLVRRIWIAYFVLAFNLGSLNVLRGHALFEFFPAIASLASFAFIMMSVLLSGRFFAAVLVMFGSGLLMAAHLLHAFLIFALAWWLVLNTIGLILWLPRWAAQGSSRTRMFLKSIGEPSDSRQR